MAVWTMQPCKTGKFQPWQTGPYNPSKLYDTTEQTRQFNPCNVVIEQIVYPKRKDTHINMFTVKVYDNRSSHLKLTIIYYSSFRFFPSSKINSAKYSELSSFISSGKALGIWIGKKWLEHQTHFAGRLVDCLIGCLIDWLVVWLANWLAGWLIVNLPSGSTKQARAIQEFLTTLACRMWVSMADIRIPTQSNSDTRSRFSSTKLILLRKHNSKEKL